MSGRVDIGTEHLSTTELRAVLEPMLSRHAARPRRITRLERQLSAYGSSLALEELALVLEDGSKLELVFKTYGPRALLEGARRVRPAFLYDPLREIQVYQTALAREQLGTATCYGAIVDRQGGRYGLFLERVPGVELWQVGDAALWQRAARWLARMHALFAGRTDEVAREASLLRYDGDFYRLWPKRVLGFVAQGSLSLSRAMRRRLTWVAERYDRAIERLLALPVTLIHGEFYASNVLVQEMPNGVRVCPVDWEMAGLGPGLIDLAALTAGKWTEAERRTLTLAYRAAMPSESRPQDQAEAFARALDDCHLHLAMQWLGWSPVWSPPPLHAQDWLGDLLRLGERLEP